MAKLSECLQAARQTFQDMSEDDLRHYIGEVQRLVNKEGVGYQQAIDQVADQERQQALDQARSIAETERKARVMQDAINNGQATLKSVMVRVMSKRDNLANNVESATKSYRNRLASRLLDALDHDQLSLLAKGDQDEAIATAYDTGVGSAQVKPIAEAIKQFQQDSDYYLLRSGAYRLSELHPKRFFKLTHDAAKLLGRQQGLINNITRTVTRQQPSIAEAKLTWKSVIKPLLDKEATFGHTQAVTLNGELDEGEIDRILDRIFDDIVQHRSDGLLDNMAAPDLATILKRKRVFFVWRDLRSFLKYSQQYGQGGLYRSAMGDLHAVSRRAGVADMFGAAPSYTYNRVLKSLPAETLKKQNRWYLTNDNIFKFITGETGQIKNVTLAALGANLRSLTGLASNGAMMVSSLSDANIAASFLSQTMAMPYFKSFTQAISGLFKQYTDRDAKQLAKMLHLHLQHEVGFIGRFVDANNVSDVSQKLNQWFYQGIGMQAKDQGHRVGVLSAMSRVMARDRHLSFQQLTPKRRAFLQQVNIDRHEWNLYRRHMHGEYWTLDSLATIADEEIRTLRQRVYGSGSDVPLSQIRLDLYRKLHTFFDVGVDHAILNPGWYEQAMMAQGTKPGTVLGEFTRCFMQFKGFLIAYWNRVLYGGFANANGTQAKLLAALQNFAYTLPLSYLSDYFYQLSQGNTMPPLENAPIKNIMSWSAPGLGILLRTLDVSHENSDLVWALLKTPSLASLGSAAAVPLRLATGDSNGSVRQLGRLAADLAPVSHVPMINPYIQALLGQPRYLEPHQQVLYGPTR